MSRSFWIFRALLPLSLVFSACRPAATSLPATSTPTSMLPLPPATAQATSRPTETAGSSVNLLSLISQDSLFTFLEGLSGIQPYSGWRSSATAGEGEALDYVANILVNWTYLRDLGLELERQSFNVFLATEISRLYLTTAGQECEVPADAPRGHRNDVVQALHFDSDGRLNDSERNPVEASGEVVLIQSAGEVDELSPGDAQGKIVFPLKLSMERMYQYEHHKQPYKSAVTPTA